jgi:hypothetical protein
MFTYKYMANIFIKTIASIIMVCMGVFFSYQASAQEISISLGETTVAMDEFFSISITAKGERVRNYDRFPDIDGFDKINTSSSSSTSIVNGQMSFSSTITQVYRPQKEGTYRLPPFTMTINGKDVNAEGAVITVVAPKGNTRQDESIWDPFEEFFGGRRSRTEYVDVKEDAFFALTTSKDQVYLGEGFNTTLALYVAEANRAQLQWYDLATQLISILEKMKPKNVWEENFAIDAVQGIRVSINGKNYTQYKIYEATFFPLALEDIQFPSVGLKMVKYRMASNPSFFGSNRQEDFVTLTTQPRTVRVKDLPAHPLKNSVPVGVYRLDERLSTANLNTGESLTYTFNVTGEGNLASLRPPIQQEHRNFEVYPPNITQNIRRAGAKVTGNKAFSYFVIPKEPGSFAMKDIFSMIYFDTERARYDTLSPRATITVEGESMRNQSITSRDFGPFYDRIGLADNDLRSLESSSYLSYIIYFMALLMFVSSGYIMFKK